MTTLMGTLQQSIRDAFSCANDFNGDLHVLADAYGVPAAPISGRMIGVANLFDSSISTASSALNYLLQNPTTVVGPRALFTQGEQGAWYDPSDLTTLFQDSAGTTPVTTIEQPVGLMLDKSKNLVLGSELVTNGDFSNGTTGWTATSSGTLPTLSVVSDRLRLVSNSTGLSGAYQAITTVAGRWYKVTGESFYVSGTSQMAIEIRDGNSLSTGNRLAIQFSAANSNASYSLYFLATGTTSYVYLRFGGTILVGATYDLDNISVKEIAGNHAYQSTSASRPTYSRRYNLLTKTEQFDDAAWGKSNVTISANTTVAPDGTTTADTANDGTATSYHRIGEQTITFTSATSYVLSAYFKYVDRQYVRLLAHAGLGLYASAVFDIQNGTVAATNAAGSGWSITSSSITAANNGFWRATVQFVSGSSASAYPAVMMSNGITFDSYGADQYTGSNKTVVVWGAQLIVTNSLTSNAYQRVNTSTDYDASSTFLPYLRFDGTDDSLLTNSINFSSTDKMTVFAGVRKLSDATSYAMLAEFSASYSANAGTFALMFPYTAGTYGFGSRQSGFGLDGYSASSYAAPITNVVDVSFDDSTTTNSSSMTARINGASAALTYSGGIGATGNFGNYPLYIGRRNNATLPFNGQLYSLIVRGAQSTAGQISATEKWVALKTGVTL